MGHDDHNTKEKRSGREPRPFRKTRMLPLLKSDGTWSNLPATVNPPHGCVYYCVEGHVIYGVPAEVRS